MSDTVQSWLRGVILADKAGAEAATPGPWSYDPGKEWYDGEDFVTMTNGQEFVGYGGSSLFRGAVCITGDSGHIQSVKDAQHIAIHDPRDTIARCEAELLLLDLHRRVDEHGAAACDGCGFNGVGDCPQVRMLASGYRHRPGYVSEWAPEGAAS